MGSIRIGELGRPDLFELSPMSAPDAPSSTDVERAFASIRDLHEAGSKRLAIGAVAAVTLGAIALAVGLAWQAYAASVVVVLALFLASLALPLGQAIRERRERIEGLHVVQSEWHALATNDDDKTSQSFDGLLTSLYRPYGGG